MEYGDQASDYLVIIHDCKALLSICMPENQKVQNQIEERDDFFLHKSYVCTGPRVYYRIGRKLTKQDRHGDNILKQFLSLSCRRLSANSMLNILNTSCVYVRQTDLLFKTSSKYLPLRSCTAKI